MDENAILNGSFFFIKDQYYIDFPDKNLMKNKERINDAEHNRPCFYSFKDKQVDIYWLIPISSQISKYQKIYNKKIMKYKEVDTIVFGYVLGNKRAFLIQNMFPVTFDYIKNQYYDPVTKKPVTVNNKLNELLQEKANKVLLLQRKGLRLIFPDVLKIEKILMGKIQLAEQYIASATDIEKENEDE